MTRPEKKNLWMMLALLAAAGGSLASCGCLALVAGGAAAGGATAYVYCKGKVCQNFLASYADTWAAAHTALRELGMRVESEESKDGSGLIQTRASNGDHIRVYVDVMPSQVPAEGFVTRVCIRVATFGDYELSDRILYQVGAHLAPPARPPAPVPAPVGPGLIPSSTWSDPRSGGSPTGGTLGPVQSPPAGGMETAPPPLLPSRPVPIPTK